MARPSYNLGFGNDPSFKYGIKNALSKDKNRSDMAKRLKSLRKSTKEGSSIPIRRSATNELRGYSAGMKQRRHPSGSPRGGQFKGKGG